MKNNRLPYTRTSEELNNTIAGIMDAWGIFIDKVHAHGFEVKFAPNSGPLELYYHDDYPNMILVDKDSCWTYEEVES